MVKKRLKIPDEIQYTVQRRTNGFCEKCRTAFTSYTLRKCLSIDNAYTWVDCWKCGKMTRYILAGGHSPSSATVYLNDLLLADNEVKALIAKRFPFYSLDRFSGETQSKYINHCQVCGIRQSYGKGSLSEFPRESIEFTDGEVYSVIKIMRPFMIHHIDEDTANNTEENLMVVCIPCHRNFHKNLKMIGKGLFDERRVVKLIGITNKQKFDEFLKSDTGFL